MRSLYFEAFPQKDARRVETKGWLFSIADFEKRVVPELKRHVLEKLLERDPMLVSALPGYVKAVKTRSRPHNLFDQHRPAEFPTLLKRLVDRNIFEPMEFLRVA